MMDLMDYGMRIRIADVRREKNVKQGELAKAIGVSRAYLSQIEKGKRNLTLSRQREIATFLGVDPSELVDFSAATDTDKAEILAMLDAADERQRALILSLARQILEQ